MSAFAYLYKVKTQSLESFLHSCHKSQIIFYHMVVLWPLLSSGFSA